MKIALSGPHGSGKTTLLERIRDERILDAVFITEITRHLQKKGFSINENGDSTTQLFIMNTHLENLFTHQSFLTDRCLLDGAVYTTYLWEQGKVEDWVLEFAYRSCKRYIEKYDLIFYIPAEFNIEDDGVRSTNDEFHARVCQLFSFYLDHLKSPNVIKLKGSVEERFKKFMEIIYAKS